MILPDVNVLVYAHHRDSVNHDRYRDAWEAIVNSQAPFGMADLVLSGFVRVVTHPKIFDTPLGTDAAFGAATAVRDRPNCVIVSPSERHWGLFLDLCMRTQAKGNLVPDAYLAALAIDSGAEFLTTDRGFARYPGLRWQHPLDN